MQITASAERDLLAHRDYIARDNPSAAEKWLRGMVRRVASLRTMPFRCERIPEQINLGREYRHLIVGNYRVIYTVDNNTVIIARVFHAARILNERHLA